MMVFTRLGTKYSTAMTELRCASAPLSSAARSFLLVRLSAPPRYFTASLRRSIPLTAIHQLRGDNLLENRHVGGNSKHVRGKLDLVYDLSCHILHSNR